MLYTVSEKRTSGYVLDDSEACVNHGTPVWETLKEARLWRDRHRPKHGIFVVLAGVSDTSPVFGEGYRSLNDTFKLLQLEDLFPIWLRETCCRVADEAWEAGILDEGYVNPDYVTAEQESVFYSKHQELVKFHLRSMLAVSLFETLEAAGVLEDMNACNDVEKTKFLH